MKEFSYWRCSHCGRSNFHLPKCGFCGVHSDHKFVDNTPMYLKLDTIDPMACSLPTDFKTMWNIVENKRSKILNLIK